MTYTLLEIALSACLELQHPVSQRLKILDDFLRPTSLSSLMQNITIGLLTVLIPFAIALFQTSLDARGRKDGTNEFDVFVIIDGVIKYKWLLFALFLSFFPTIIWEVSVETIRFFGFLSWLLGTSILIWILNSNVKWVKGGGNEIRLNFIRSMSVYSSDLVKVWRAIWNNKNTLNGLENDFLQTFSHQIDGLIRKQKYSLVENLIDSLLNNIEKRSSFAISGMSHFFSKLLEWHKIFWLNSEELIHTDQINDWSQQEELERKTNQLFLDVLVKVVHLGRLSLLMDKFQSHVEQNLELQSPSPGREVGYIESILNTFMNVVLERVTELDRQYQVWRWIFPSDWKLTKDSMSGPKKRIVWIVFNQFLSWCIERMNKESNDFYVDHVISEMIPETDPIIWARMIIFCFAPYGDSKVTSVVRREWSIGHIGRSFTFFGEPNDEQLILRREAEERNTFQLLLTIQPFSDYLSLQKIEQYLSELSEYEPENENERSNKLWLQLVFAKLKGYIENEEHTSD